MFELILTLWLASEAKPIVLAHPGNPFPTLEACRAEIVAQTARSLEGARRNGLERGTDFDFQMRCVPLAGEGV